MNPTFSPYAELGVRPDVTLQELKQAYRQAVLRYHPDSAVGAANSLKFHAVTEAYKELRAIVDQSPREKGSEHLHPTSRKKNQLLDGEQLIDHKTLELDVLALQQLLCESDNSHVRKVAAIALFLKKEVSLTRELLTIAKQPAMPSIRKAILSAMHIGPRKKVVPILLSVACECDLEIAVIAIQQLEKIDASLRGKILFSDNSHVRKVAAIALFLKKEVSLTRELLTIAKQPAMPSIRKAILSAMHIGPRKKVVPILLSVACECDLEIAVIAIQQLEKIDASLRGKILFKLRMAHLSLWERTKRVFDPDLLLITQYSQLGDQLCQRGLLSQEQLQIALVLQKKFPLLLGQILRQLNYVQPHELRSVLGSPSQS